jgi:hypothetical protein
MKQNILPAEGFESTYALIVRSEEKERGLFEGAAYLVFILSAIFSIWSVAQQPVTFPKGGVIHTTSITQSADKSQRA